MKVKEMCYIAVFVVMLTIGSYISLPIGIVPVTLQTLFVMLIGLCLKKSWSLWALGLYVFMGLVGLPVFGGSGGIGTLLSPTFGYIIGFVFGGFLISFLKSYCHNWIDLLMVCILGNIVIYVFGLFYFIGLNYVMYGKYIELNIILYSFCIIFIPGDLIKCGVAVFLYERLKTIKPDFFN